MHLVQTAGRATQISGRALAALSITATVGLIADQVTKAIALATLPEGGTVPFIEGVWHWTLQRNPGAAFSLFTRVPWLFTIIAFAISAGIIWYARRVRDTGLALALGFVLGGALGNLADRVLRPPAPFRGHVIDFIDFRIWPTFNIADVCVVTGAALLFLHSVRAERAAERAAEDAAGNGDGAAAS